MGLTTECASCHDHKFDPISQREFYQLFAFFNSLDRNPMDGNRKDYEPVLRVANDEQKAKLQAMEDKVVAAREAYRQALEAFEYSDPEPADVADNIDEAPNEAAEDAKDALASQPQPKPQEFVWIDDELPAGAKAEGTWQYQSRESTEADDPRVFSGLRSSFEKSSGFSQHFFTGASLPLQVGPNDTLFAHVYLDPKDPPRQIMLQFNDGSWDHRAYWGANEINFGTDGTSGRQSMGELPETGGWVRLEVPAAQVGFTSPSLVNGWAFSQSNGTVYWDCSGVVSELEQQLEFNSFNRWLEFFANLKGKSLPGPQAKLLREPLEKLNENQRKQLLQYFLTEVLPASREHLLPLKSSVSAAEQQRDQFRNSLPTTLISSELDAPKPAFLLKRGQYDDPGPEVERRVPAALPPLDADQPRNRLGFANWLVADNHPLTSRVAVNRFWQQVFGTGLVKTSEDFGSQGEWPSHPELLDFLARDFMESGWDIKRFMRRLVLSSTYRQSSAVSPRLWARDPEKPTSLPRSPLPA